MSEGAPSGRSGSESQAAERVVQLLEALAKQGAPMTIAELSEAMGLHRSIVYRYLRTLDRLRFVRTTADGSYEPGIGLIPLANSVSLDLRTIALPDLQQLADELGATAFLTQLDGDRTICLASVEPRRSVAHVAFRPGSYGPIDRGAPALAIASTEPEHRTEPDEVTIVRKQGYAHSVGTLMPGVESLACPLRTISGSSQACIAVIFPVGSLDLDTAADAVHRAADSIAALMA